VDRASAVAVTAKEGVVGMRSMPGSPYDGHVLHSQLEQMQILTGVRPSTRTFSFHGTQRRLVSRDTGPLAAGGPPGELLDATRRRPTYDGLKSCR